jgi:hypothetical protein
LRTVLSYDPQELVIDGDWRADDIIYALEHIPLEQQHRDHPD